MTKMTILPWQRKMNTEPKVELLGGVNRFNPKY